jgi:hypothetical protein
MTSVCVFQPKAKDHKSGKTNCVGLSPDQINLPKRLEIYTPTKGLQLLWVVVTFIHLTLFVVVDQAYFRWVRFWLGNGNRGRVCHRGHGCGWHHKSRHVSLIELFAKITGGGRRLQLEWQLATLNEVTGFLTYSVESGKEFEIF